MKQHRIILTGLAMILLLTSTLAQSQSGSLTPQMVKKKVFRSEDGTPGRITKWADTGFIGNSVIAEDAAGNIGIGTTPTARLTVNGLIETTEGGIKFPDGTVQTTAMFSAAGVPLNLTGSILLPIISATNNGAGTAIRGFNSAGGFGVIGESVGNIGVTGLSTDGIGVLARSTSATGLSATSTNGDGIFGSSSNAHGIRALSNSTDSSDAGIFGIGRPNGAQAGRFNGNVSVSGTLSKGGGSFKIDHPLDPENKYLSHSFVESPDMMNIYNGNVTTDHQGFATVELPEWFDSLNSDFRYQLTVVGQFAQAIVAEEVRDNRFVIQTSAPGVKVSWQVTGVRQDAWAKKNRIPVEERKSERERGFYLHPEAFGQAEERGIDWAHRPDQMHEIKQRRLEADQSRRQR